MEIKSQDVLEDLSLDNKDRFVRTIAASRISDPNILKEIAYNAKYSDVRQIAFDQLGMVENVFAEIAKFDKKGKNRFAAVREVNDEINLLEVVSNNKERKIKIRDIV